MTVCLECGIDKTCRIQNPIRWEGKSEPIIPSPAYCAYRTCAMGLAAAVKAQTDQLSSEPEIIRTVEGETIEGAIKFGTYLKPTHISSSSIHRWIGPDGRIFANVLNTRDAGDEEHIVFTGQTIDILSTYQREGII